MNSGDTILYFWESAGGKLPCATQLDFLDILFIPGIFAKCGDWHDMLSFRSRYYPQDMVLLFGLYLKFDTGIGSKICCSFSLDTHSPSQYTQSTKKRVPIKEP